MIDQKKENKNNKGTGLSMLVVAAQFTKIQDAIQGRGRPPRHDGGDGGQAPRDRGARSDDGGPPGAAAAVRPRARRPTCLLCSVARCGGARLVELCHIVGPGHRQLSRARSALQGPSRMAAERASAAPSSLRPTRPSVATATATRATCAGEGADDEGASTASSS